MLIYNHTIIFIVIDTRHDRIELEILPVTVEETVLGAEVAAPKANNPALGVVAAAVVVVGDTTFVFPKVKDVPLRDDFVDVTSGGLVAPNENAVDGATGATTVVEEVERVGEEIDGIGLVIPTVVDGLSEPNENEPVGALPFPKLNPPVGNVVVDVFGG